jgi:transcriptional regulator with GAF, ATPase, and Fis domain
MMVAGTDSSVLISGETGTGKELIARAIYQLSRRNKRSFITVNCAALPAGLIESELLGHEKGAFTGAVSKRIGRFELADGGTIFLDEISDLSQEIQAKLLRVLQYGEFERVGGSKTIKVNVRLIAATNRHLTEAMGNNDFRADLYYRLNVFPVFLPPLRERREDIPLLTWYFGKIHKEDAKGCS